MAITQERLTACKNYMRVDFDEEDALIVTLMESAVEYLAAAGVPEPASWGGRYAQSVWALTLHSYDHRDDISAQVPLPPALRLLITQCKLQAESAAAVGEVSGDGD